MNDPIPTSSKREAGWFEMDDDHNTYVYVTGLPLDITEEDFIDLMKKYGIIAKKDAPGKPFNIKLYTDKEGKFKGDARCCYARKESVELAILNLHEYKYIDNHKNEHILDCAKAKFEMKGSYDPTKKPRALDKKAKIKKKKIVDKLLSWDSKTTPEISQKKVILKNMFTPEEILEGETTLEDLKEDVNLKCSEIECEPKRVDIYDNHPEGVIAVTFAEPHQATKCVEKLNNEWYAQRQVRAELWDGKSKYKLKETDEELKRRLSRWHRDIQNSDDETG